MTTPHRARARRVLVVALIAALVAACGSGGDDDAATTTSSTTTTTVDPVIGVTTAYETVFDGANKDRAAKVALLEDPVALGALYDKAIKDKSFSDLLSQVTARVEEVRVTSPTTAELDYNLIIDGKPVTEGTFLGRAVLVDGTWRVAAATLCNLLILGNPDYSSEPVCKSA